MIASINNGDLYTNGTLDLGQFFQRLQKEAGIHKISQLKLLPSKKALEVISFESFKHMGHIILNTLRVKLLNSVIIIENKSRRQMESDWHYSPVE